MPLKVIIKNGRREPVDLFLLYLIIDGFSWISIIDGFSVII